MIESGSMYDKRLKKKRAMQKKGMLSGGQAKLDKNKNNRIDAQDFKILKAEKAKGRGMGLQDEKLKPGKVMKAKRGMSFSQKMKMVEEGKINKKTGKFTSMDAMREAKGFKPGESAADFNKRKANEAFAKRAAKATGARGKIALGIAAAGVGAYNYLKSKMKKKEKKMGGGMMQKPLGYKVGSKEEPMTQTKVRGRAQPKGARRLRGINLSDIILKKVGDVDIVDLGLESSKYKDGGSVTAKCKLGRNKPTKIY